jgi:cell division protein FtsL
MMQIRLCLSTLILISSLIISTTAKENDAGQFLVSEKKVKLGKRNLSFEYFRLVLEFMMSLVK